MKREACDFAASRALRHEGSARDQGVILEERDGICFTGYEDAATVPREELVSLLLEAWGQSYRSRAVWVIDREYLDWLTPPGCAGMIVARDATGRALGCELIVDREIEVSGRRLRAAYAALLTVRPEARRRGVAQGMLEHLTSMAIRRGAEVIVAAYDSDASGQPTVEKFLRTSQQQQWSMRLSPAFPIWAATRDLTSVHAFQPLDGAARLALLPGVRGVLEVKRARAAAGKSPVPRGCRIDAVCPEPASRLAVRVLPARGLEGMYPASERAAAGTFAGSCGALAYHVPEVAKPGLVSRRMCQIQLTSCAHSARRLSRTLDEFNEVMFERGVLCNFLVDCVGYSRVGLLAARYLPTARRVSLALRGPTRLLSELDLSGPHWALDVL
jgi:GNAT superfamily N-acetyltransferase